jgi:hypothetical protein
VIWNKDEEAYLKEEQAGTKREEEEEGHLIQRSSTSFISQEILAIW